MTYWNEKNRLKYSSSTRRVCKKQTLTNGFSWWMDVHPSFAAYVGVEVRWRVRYLRTWRLINRKTLSVPNDSSLRWFFQVIKSSWHLDNTAGEKLRFLVDKFVELGSQTERRLIWPIFKTARFPKRLSMFPWLLLRITTSSKVAEWFLEAGTYGNQFRSLVGIRETYTWRIV